MKKTKKIGTKVLAGLAIVGMLATFFVPAVVNVVQASEVLGEVMKQSTTQVDDTLVLTNNLLSYEIQDFSEKEQREIEIGLKLSEYFVLDELGNPTLVIDSETLIKELGMTLEEAREILNFSVSVEEGMEMSSFQSKQRGFVGLHINLGPSTRKQGAWAAGVYVGGYIGWHLKQLATTPHGAGVVALVSGGIVLAVKSVIERGLTRLSIGADIPFVSLSYTVSTP